SLPLPWIQGRRQPLGAHPPPAKPNTPAGFCGVTRWRGLPLGMVGTRREEGTAPPRLSPAPAGRTGAGRAAASAGTPTAFSSAGFVPRAGQPEPDAPTEAV